MQHLVDILREKLAFRHQAAARRHMAKRDHWRWQIERPWPELIPTWWPWMALVAFWLVVAWVFWP